MNPGDLLQMTEKIGLAALLAGVIGAEREWTGKWAGLRTHMLIAVGSALVTEVSLHFGDNGRLAAQVVSGVGFLGAGTIIQSRGAVHGLTTAAGLWVAAALGIAVGAGAYGEAVVATVALLFILSALRPLERRLQQHDRRTVVAHLAAGQKLADLLAVVGESRIEIEDLSRSPGSPAVLLHFRGSPQDSHRLIELADLAGIRVTEELGGAPPMSSAAGGPVETGGPGILGGMAERPPDDAGDC
ncbi:MAG TPA: MgtC/SapB family protein [Thermoanaerobaculia bacterium]|nr:MgtC/SapB family protein [Thermoanaerobaculia bacterium]